MKKNVGMADRIIRLIVAAVIAVLYFTGTISGTLSIVLIVLAAVFVFTATIGTCFLYLPFGLSTKKEKSQTQS